MTDDKPRAKILVFPTKQPVPSAEECFAKARALMASADETMDLDRKAELLLEAGEWLKLAEAKR
ncbi:hypothetical protein GJW-30_1_01962 [Variibacter gotjawalensis]|uniref:Uncharacterized protein n=1 Tax=Variibacter gotjawalensis TaxID=1333996 RepID=A0A0S3PTY0_9BRAD|nr:hypothetical protein EV661_4080 [Variibacter gotjawalensis]BAT59429.1 hypothetical protein GJW-30_1_01962 [Variibacter gotjawalensis]